MLPNSNKNEHGIEKHLVRTVNNSTKFYEQNGLMRNFEKRKKSLNATKQMMHTQETLKNLVAFMQ